MWNFWCEETHVLQQSKNWKMGKSLLVFSRWGILLKTLQRVVCLVLKCLQLQRAVFFFAHRSLPLYAYGLLCLPCLAFSCFSEPIWVAYQILIKANEVFPNISFLCEMRGRTESNFFGSRVVFSRALVAYWSRVHRYGWRDTGFGVFCGDIRSRVEQGREAGISIYCKLERDLVF